MRWPCASMSQERPAWAEAWSKAAPGMEGSCAGIRSVAVGREVDGDPVSVEVAPGGSVLTRVSGCGISVCAPGGMMAPWVAVSRGAGLVPEVPGWAAPLPPCCGLSQRARTLALPLSGANITLRP